MRLFKHKTFNRWAQDNRVSDQVIWKAAEEVVEGKFDADLGGNLFKKRIAREGEGKSKGFRTLVGYRRPDSERVVFLYAFAKNVRANITDAEKKALRLASKSFVSTSDEQLALLLERKEYYEVIK